MLSSVKPANAFGVVTHSGDFFEIRSGLLTAYSANDSFYGRNPMTPVRRYWSEWRMTENDAVQMARQFLDTLHYWHHPCFYDLPAKKVQKTVKAGLHTIARYYIEFGGWNKSAWVEIDAGTKTVKAFSVRWDDLDKKAMARAAARWGHPSNAAPVVPRSPASDGQGFNVRTNY